MMLRFSIFYPPFIFTHFSLHWKDFVRFATNCNFLYLIDDRRQAFTNNVKMLISFYSGLFITRGGVEVMIHKYYLEMSEHGDCLILIINLERIYLLIYLLWPERLKLFSATIQRFN